MQYSPKLKIAMQEIKKILLKHDIAGVIILHTPGHTEYLNKIDPSYSAIKVNGDEISVRLKLQDFDGDKKKQKEAAENTSNLLHSVSSTAFQIAAPLAKLSSKVDEILGVEHRKGNHTSSTTQQN